MKSWKTLGYHSTESPGLFTWSSVAFSLCVCRQVENIRRVYAAVEEAQHQINLLNFLEAHFALPHNLARKYCCLLFILMGKFSVSSKRRVQRASLQDICDCAAVSMACLMTDSSIFAAYWGYVA
jgi:hypothetical protein